jgi:acetyl esterase/lipase
VKIVESLTYLSALLASVPFFKSDNLTVRALLWPFKILAGALAPVLGLVSGLGALLGLARRDWKLAGAGLAGAGLAVRFLQDLPDSAAAFAAAFGPGWVQGVPVDLRPHLQPHRWAPVSPPPGPATWQRNLVYAEHPQTGAPLRADLWRPAPGGAPTGLGIVYVHGGGWRVGAKDMGTRSFFRRLAGQGHTILDIDYSLCPQADVPAMVAQVKEAVLWLKAHGGDLGLDPARVVLMGGSAGGHLALLAAYTADYPQLPPLSGRGDASVRGVVAFYPPVDFQTLASPPRADWPAGRLDRAVEAGFNGIFALRDEECETALTFTTMIPALLGGHADDVPETYRLLSPLAQVGPHCPPTLLLQGSDDVFFLAPAVRRLDQDLRRAGVPSILVEFPHTEHGFDLALPRLSPVAQAATYDVELFLALLI